MGAGVKPGDEVVVAGVHRVDEFAAQQRQGCAVVQHDVVERVRDDLHGPHDARLHVAREAELKHAEEQRARSDR